MKWKHISGSTCSISLMYFTEDTVSKRTHTHKKYFPRLPKEIFCIHLESPLQANRLQSFILDMNIVK